MGDKLDSWCQENSGSKNGKKYEKGRLIGNSGKALESKRKFNTKEPGFAPQPGVSRED
jgi:hypothetical protein